MLSRLGKSCRCAACLLTANFCLAGKGVRCDSHHHCRVLRPAKVLFPLCYVLLWIAMLYAQIGESSMTTRTNT